MDVESNRFKFGAWEIIGSGDVVFVSEMIESVVVVVVVAAAAANAAAAFFFLFRFLCSLAGTAALAASGPPGDDEWKTWLK